MASAWASSTPAEMVWEPPAPVNLLVVGECGDGKSTLIDAMRDKNASVAPRTGMSPDGVTKDLLLYKCPDLEGGVPLNLIDTPGVGDGTVLPMALIALIEAFLAKGSVPGGIRGVLVTNPISDCRIKLGAQVVQIIVDKGFISNTGEDKYGNIVLVGTKADKADADEKENFIKGTDGNKSVRELFFHNAKPPGCGAAVMVSKHNYSELIDAIRSLPATIIHYKTPPAKEMAGALAAKLGMEPAVLEEEIGTMREIVKELSAKFTGLMQEMFNKDQEHRRENREMNEKMLKIQEKIAQDAQAADKLRQEMLVEFDKERKEAREDRRVVQEALQRREEEIAKNQAMLQALQAERQRDNENQQSLMREMQEAQRRSFEESRRAAEGSQMMQMMGALLSRSTPAPAPAPSGGGCFPALAQVETPQGPKPMAALQAGDRVQAMDASGRLFFDEVYFFGHAQAEEWQSCAWLRTRSGRVLCASPDHQVPVALPGGAAGAEAAWSRAAYRRAASVRPGERLWVRGATGGAELEAVTEVGARSEQGVFNPFTLSGTVVVDGVVASVHSDWLLDSVLPESWLHAVYQAMLLPGRGLYRLLGPGAADMLEVNNPQGKWSTTVGTSPRAFAFFLAAYLVPTAAVTTALVQRMASE